MLWSPLANQIQIESAKSLSWVVWTAFHMFTTENANQRNVHVEDTTQPREDRLGHTRLGTTCDCVGRSIVIYDIHMSATLDEMKVFENNSSGDNLSTQRSDERICWRRLSNEGLRRTWNSKTASRGANNERSFLGVNCNEDDSERTNVSEIWRITAMNVHMHRTYVR